MIKVYIASPYTADTEKEMEKNVIRSFAVYNQLTELGFKPYAPLTCHYIHKHYPQTYNGWMQIDLFWLAQCECLLRVPGESKGADIEVQYAQNKLKIPVFYSISELKAYYVNHPKKKCFNCYHNKNGVCVEFNHTIRNIYTNSCPKFKTK